MGVVRRRGAQQHLGREHLGAPQGARREAELDVLAADVLGVVRETLEPGRARLWLVAGEEVHR
jgi:hypothetical protein